MSGVHHGIRFGGLLVLGLAAIATTPGNARADEPSPEQTLRQKGLVRSGATYVLQAAGDLSNHVAELDRRFAEWKREQAGLDERLEALGRLRLEHQEIVKKLRTLSGRRPEPKGFGPRGFPDDGRRGPGPGPPPPDSGPFQSGPGPPPPPPADDMGGFGGPMDEMMRQLGIGDGRRQYGLLNAERARLAGEIVYRQVGAEDLARKLEVESLEIDRRRLEAVALDQEIRARHDKLASDRQIKLALATLSKRDGTALSPGPPTDYSKRLSELATALKETREAMLNRMAQFPLKGRDRMTGLVGLGETLAQKLGTNAVRIQTLEREAASRGHLLAEENKQHERLIESLEHAVDLDERHRLRSQLRAKDSRLETLRGRREEIREALGKAHQLVASERQDYLRIVKALEDAIDETDKEERLATNVTNTRDSNTGRPPRARNASVVGSTEAFKITLREFMKSIRTETVPIDVDKTIDWIEANLNGKSHKLMVIDTGIPEIRLCARLASEVGVERSADEPVVAIATLGGPTMPASRGRLAMITVGPFTLHDVDCLILPESAGEVPSILGAEFFQRFSTGITADRGAIVLTEVDVKPIHHAGKPSASKAAGSSRAKKTAPAAGLHP